MSSAGKMTTPDEPREAAQGKAPAEPKCPRCGDMFYHPKTLIEDARQHAKEWEEQWTDEHKLRRAAEAEVEQLKVNLTDTVNWKVANKIKAENARLRAALEFYAETDNWPYAKKGGCPGKIARQALGEE